MFRFALAAAASLLATTATAATTGFVSNPSSNSSDWAAAVAAAGGTVVTGLDFEAHPIGALQGGFYAGSLGVTIAGAGAVGSVVDSAGPGQGNTTLSQPGEGTNTASNQLRLGSNPSSLTFTFDAPVIGAGIETIDAFSSIGNPLQLEVEAFSGANGGGSSLGVFSSVQQNFQNNNVYFMGLTSDTPFLSFVFRDLTNNGGDVFAVDDFVFATGTGGSAVVPLPATLPLLAAGFGLLAWRGRRRA